MEGLPCGLTAGLPSASLRDGKTLPTFAWRCASCLPQDRFLGTEPLSSGLVGIPVRGHVQRRLLAPARQQEQRAPSIKRLRPLAEGRFHAHPGVPWGTSLPLITVAPALSAYAIAPNP